MNIRNYIYMAMLIWLTQPLLAIAVESAQITGVRPINFNQLKPFGSSATFDQDLCVYSSTGSYTVQVASNNPSGSFVVNNLNMKPINYQVFWNKQLGTANNIELRALNAQIQSGASMTPSCPNGNTANLQVVIPDAALSGARAGSYYLSLQITVAPVAPP